MSDKYAALKAAAEKATPGGWVMSNEHSLRIRDSEQKVIASAGYADDRQEVMDATFIAAANPATILELLAERDADKTRIAELTESHSKLRDTMATIHNTIRMDGGYTPLAAILNASKRAHEESAAAAGISLKIEGE